VLTLGVDPGSIVTGWGLVEDRGGRLRAVGAGVLELGAKKPLEERLRILHVELTAIVEAHRPDAFAVEDLFFAKHANAALKLGHARGVALLVAATSGLSVSAYPPAVVKRTIAGRGAADKAQVAQIVGAILGMKELPKIDASDALAVAITHARASRVGALTEAAAARRRR
jgi:crossover junction endodeoxyribonuclease RuvC